MTPAVRYVGRVPLGLCCHECHGPQIYGVHREAFRCYACDKQLFGPLTKDERYPTRIAHADL